MDTTCDATLPGTFCLYSCSRELSHPGDHYDEFEMFFWPQG